MKTLAPEERIGGEEVSDFVAAKIENERSPILMRSFARIFVFVKRGAVEFRQRPFITRKMRGNPIDQHTNARFVQRGDEKLEFVRRSETAGRRIKTGHLITP